MFVTKTMIMILMIISSVRILLPILVLVIVIICRALKRGHQDREVLDKAAWLRVQGFGLGVCIHSRP